MNQARQHAAIAAETIERRRRGTIAVEKLDGEPALEPTVASRCEPYFAHTSAPHQGTDRVRADLRANFVLTGYRRRAVLEEAQAELSGSLLFQHGRRPAS
jgi:hypothetical protein